MQNQIFIVGQKDKNQIGYKRIKNEFEPDCLGNIYDNHV